MRHHILLVFLFFNLHGFTQSTFFKLIDTNKNNTSSQLFTTVDGFVYGVTYNGAFDNVFYKFDNEGNQIFKKEIYGFGPKIYTSVFKKNGILLFGNAGKYYSKLVILDSLGEVISDQKIADDGLFRNARNIVDMGDGYIIQSEILSFDQSGDTINITRIDYNGKIIWDKRFRIEDHPYVGTQIASLVRLGKDEFIVTGIFLYFDKNVPNPQGAPYVFKFNSNGEIIYNKRYSIKGKFLPTKYFSTGINDSDYVVIERKDTFVNFPGNDWATAHPLFVAYNNHDELIWQTVVPIYLDEDSRVGDYRTGISGDIFHLSYTRDHVLYKERGDGFRLIRLGPDGKLKWQRAYLPPAPFLKDNITFLSFSFDYMTELTDGGIIIVGVYRYTDNNTKMDKEHAYILKLDSMGCMNIGCDRFSYPLDVTFTKIDDLNEVNPEVILFPNPAMDRLNVHWSSTLNLLSYEIYNTSGVILDKNTVPKNGIINVSDYHIGIYLIKLFNKNGQIYWVKFIKS